MEEATTGLPQTSLWTRFVLSGQGSAGKKPKGLFFSTRNSLRQRAISNVASRTR